MSVLYVSTLFLSYKPLKFGIHYYTAAFLCVSVCINKKIFFCCRQFGIKIVYHLWTGSNKMKKLLVVHRQEPLWRVLSFVVQIKRMHFFIIFQKLNSRLLEQKDKNTILIGRFSVFYSIISGHRCNCFSHATLNTRSLI